MNNLVKILFYGNIFYGFCAVALCIESNLLQGFSINYFPFYLLIFFCSWIYYTMIYVRSSTAYANSPINYWYRVNIQKIKRILFTIVILVAGLFVFFIVQNYVALKTLTIGQWLLLASIPLSGLLYTFQLPISFLKKFRQIGWLKPFIIGYTWSGWVTLFPTIAFQLQQQKQGPPIYPNLQLWFLNFLFITVLAIIFDVKDYNIDVRKRLKTIPAQLGIANTYSYVIIPFSLLTIIVLLWFQTKQPFTFAQIFIQLIPFVLLITEVLKRHKQQNIFYYLVYIDGLMLLKAICGIISIQLL